MNALIDNPFLITGYESPEYFCDRDAETKDLMETLRNGRNITLISPRRMGKSALIKHAYYQLGREDAAIKTIYIDLYPTESLYDFTKTFALAVLGQLDSVGSEGHTLEQVFSYLKSVERTCYIALDEFQQIGNYPEKNIEALHEFIYGKYYPAN